MSASPISSTPDELPALDQLWQDCLEHLEKNLPSQQFKTWVAPLALGGWNPSRSPIQIDILAPNRFKQTWAREQLMEPLTNWWQARLQQAVTLQILLTADPGIDPVTASETAAVDSSANHRSPDTAPEAAYPTQPLGQETARLNPEWTFDLFVPGKANQLARAAALQVADNPGSGYNPLFLYGGVGLGKSHLIHSVGNKMLEENPAA